ncbi:MAG: hypothetical protein HYY65_14025 [Candidatus Tectomicrobia bacterium]|uniref:Uncharacterized protein n=1 Tax=Tectimicrobiota bacterium TaxID=2528274 RepID=A0A932GS99_UNCTE|nr:hypothetical protein [Candidatus Tectomicrobia bacterium]
MSSARWWRRCGSGTGGDLGQALAGSIQRLLSLVKVDVHGGPIASLGRGLRRVEGLAAPLEVLAEGGAVRRLEVRQLIDLGVELLPRRAHLLHLGEELRIRRGRARLRLRGLCL